MRAGHALHCRAKDTKCPSASLCGLLDPQHCTLQVAGKQDQQASGRVLDQEGHQTDPELKQLELQHALDRQAVEQIRTRLAAAS